MAERPARDPQVVEPDADRAGTEVHERLRVVEGPLAQGVDHPKGTELLEGAGVHDQGS